MAEQKELTLGQGEFAEPETQPLQVDPVTGFMYLGWTPGYLTFYGSAKRLEAANKKYEKKNDKPPKPPRRPNAGIGLAGRLVLEL